MATRQITAGLHSAAITTVFCSIYQLCAQITGLVTIQWRTLGFNHFVSKSSQNLTLPIAWSQWMGHWPSSVSLETTPPRLAVLSVMLLRWARVVVSWMKRSLVSTPIIAQRSTLKQTQLNTKCKITTIYINEMNTYKWMEKLVCFVFLLRILGLSMQIIF